MHKVAQKFSEWCLKQVGAAYGGGHFCLSMVASLLLFLVCRFWRFFFWKMPVYFLNHSNKKFNLRAQIHKQQNEKIIRNWKISCFWKNEKKHNYPALVQISAIWMLFWAKGSHWKAGRLWKEEKLPTLWRKLLVGGCFVVVVVVVIGLTIIIG